MGYLETRANLEGKVAAIIGGGGGLGRASAVDLGRAGVALALCDRNESLLAATTEEILAAGGRVTTSVLDARDREPLEAFFAGLDETYGRLDVLVNVVGGTFGQPFEESTPRGWEAIIRANFVAMLHATHLAIPRMKASGGGSIISFTSIEGHRAAPRYAVYSGMKAAVTNFTRTLAIELAPDAIRVNTVAPDMIPTEGLAGVASRPDQDPAERALGTQIAIPMGRTGDYEDVGGCILFLASDLSRFVTGTSLHPDGGTFASAGWFNWPDDGFRNSIPTALLDSLLHPD